MDIKTENKNEHSKLWKERFKLWGEHHETAWQFILYMLMGCFTTAVDFGSFALFNFWLFTAYRNQPFSWWLIDYPVENGGLAAFLAFACSCTISETFNFIVQRKTTFKANNNIAKSAVMYAIMIILIYFLQLYLPTLTRAPIVAVLGATLGDILAKTINMTTTMLISFPINKWLIMRKT
jgi:putative flippase GtrA